MSAQRVLIADDEQVARQRLRRLLGEIDDVEVVGECADGVEVLARLRDGGVDVVLLDINMPRLSGMEAAGLTDAGGPAIIFATAHPEHAVEAFDQDAADYLLKPIDAERLERALARARKRRASSPSVPASDGLPERLAVSTLKGLVLVDPAKITHAVIDGATCLLHTEQGRFVTDFRLADLERRLPAGRFERLHRKALVNMDHVERLEPVESGGYVAHVKGGHRVEVSRGAARRLRRVWTLPR